MKTEEIDKIIEESLAEGRKQKYTHVNNKQRQRLNRIRNVLNVIFMIGFVLAVILYFALPNDKTLFFITGFGALSVKIVEFIVRFRC